MHEQMSGRVSWGRAKGEEVSKSRRMHGRKHEVVMDSTFKWPGWRSTSKQIK